MKVKFRQKFEKDLESILDQKVLDAIADTISDVENAQKIQEIKNIKKMKGSKNAYRIKINRHRIGLFLVDDTFEFTRVLPRDQEYCPEIKFTNFSPKNLCLPNFASTFRKR